MFIQIHIFADSRGDLSPDRGGRGRAAASFSIMKVR